MPGACWLVVVVVVVVGGRGAGREEQQGFERRVKRWFDVSGGVGEGYTV